MSSVSWIRASQLARMLSTYSSCSVVSVVPRRRLVKPAIPFSGVRISWLIVERNRLLERSPSAARSRASRSVASPRLVSVMSSKMVTKQASRPLASLTGLTQPRTA